MLLKVALTLGWVTSLLLFPNSWQERVGLPPEGNLAVFIRLLGMAYTALLVGYGFGYFDIRKGIYARGVVWTGIVSNGGACVLLVVFRNTWNVWGSCAPAIMWASLVATGLITAGLIAFGPCGRFHYRE